MSVDREQVRRDALQFAYDEDPGSHVAILADYCIALLAELEEARQIATNNALAAWEQAQK